MNKIKSMCKLNNSGYTLVELIVAIAILGIMTAGMSIGVGLAFSKDAAQCATKLNDAIYEARMDAMSKVGTYTLTVKKADTGNDFEAIIKNNDIVEETIPISERGKIASIKVNTNDIGTLVIKFDKAKGYVSEAKVNGTDIIGSSDGIIEFDIKQKNGEKHEFVSLITVTGKHTVGKYE